MAVYDISEPAEPRQIGFMPIEGGGIHRIWYTGGRWAYASALLDGFTDYIFITHRHGRPDEAASRRALVDPRHEPGGGRDARLGADAALRPAPSDRQRRHRLLRLARRRHGRCSTSPTAASPKLIVHRNWSPPFGGGTHNCLPLPDRDLLVRARRGGARQLRGRPQADLAVRHPRAVEPDQHLDLPDAVGGGLREQGRPFRPAQRLREPPGRLRQLGDSSSRPTRTPACASSTSATSTGRSRSAPSCRRRPPRLVDHRPNRPRVIQSCDVFVDKAGARSTPTTTMAASTSSSTRDSGDPGMIDVRSEGRGS